MRPLLESGICTLSPRPKLPSAWMTRRHSRSLPNALYHTGKGVAVVYVRNAHVNAMQETLSPQVTGIDPALC